MKSYFLNVFISAIFLLTVFSEVKAQKSDYLNDENMELLCTLDSLLSHAGDFVKEKEDTISRLRAKYMRSQDLEQMYWTAVGLYDEYASFDSDSALYYVGRCADFAGKLSREDLCVSSELNRIYVLTATGLLDKATASLHRLDRSAMDPKQKLRYYELNINLLSQRINTKDMRHPIREWPAA